jgi:hypothetical protein
LKPQKSCEPVNFIVEPSQPLCMNLTVDTGHFPSWPRIETRSPCISSSQTLSTVPAFPSVRIAALPTSSVWACSNSPRIVDARTFTVGMDDLQEFERSVFAFERCARRDRHAAGGTAIVPIWKLEPASNRSSVDRQTCRKLGRVEPDVGLLPSWLTQDTSGDQPPNVRFSNRPFGVKRFQTIHHHNVDVARGLVFLFGIGTKVLPSWDSKTRRNNLWGGLAVLQTVDPSGHTNSPHPSSREGHHPTARWSSSVLLSPERLLCRRDFPGPPELGAVNPDAVHDHGQPTRQRHDRLLHPAVPGDLHRPGLEP